MKSAFDNREYPVKPDDEAKEAEALAIAIEAMKKQEPMNPVIEQGAPSYYGGAWLCRDYCGCPKCGEEVPEFPLNYNV